MIESYIIHQNEKSDMKKSSSICVANDCCVVKLLQGSHRNSKTQFHDFSMINNVISMTN